MNRCWPLFEQREIVNLSQRGNWGEGHELQEGDSFQRLNVNRDAGDRGVFSKLFSTIPKQFELGWRNSMSSNSGKPGNTTFLIRVTGTSGLDFDGSYLVIGPDVSKSERVHGRTPQEYTVWGRMVSTTFHKRSTDGILRVEIVKNGEITRSSETTAAYGVVVAAVAVR